MKSIALIMLLLILSSCNGNVSSQKSPAKARTKADDEVSSAVKTFNQNTEKGLNELIKLANSGNDKAACLLGTLYARGNGVPASLQKAEMWYKKSAAKGNDEAEYFLGLYYLTGAAQGINKNIREGIRLLEDSASKGNDKSMGYLGKQLFLGKIMAKDINRGMSLMKQSADMDNGQAQYDYAASIFFNDNGPRDLNTARTYCAKSFEHNIDNSKKLLAFIDIDILKSQPITDDSAYALGNNYMLVGEYNNAKSAFRRACYGRDESDSRNPQSPACMMYYRLETGM